MSIVSAPDSGGFLLIDKPKGWTSFDVVAKVRRLTGVKRIGHAGTLDPLATGLLIVAIGRSATKQLNALLGLDKVYVAELTCGMRSTTDDAEGEITKGHDLPDDDTFKEEMRLALSHFTGKILQIPPAFSAVKVNGMKAYRAARKGKPLALAARPVTIHTLTLQKCHPPRITLRIHCSKGTYIRSLARDLGEYLAYGAYLSELRRTAIGPYRIEDAHTIEEVAQGVSQYILHSL